MSTEFRGKVKEKFWVRPTCADDSDPFHLGQKARRDFKDDCWVDEVPVDVVAPDVLDEALELGDPPIPDPDDNRAES
jgi:hypothetical protein